MTQLNIVTVCILFCSAALGDDRTVLKEALLFHASFNGSTEAGLFTNDGMIYTAESMAMKKVRGGNHIPEVSIAKGAGRFGDALRFSAKTKQVLFYKATDNDLKPVDDWSGTVSFWLKLNPDKDLPQGFCDPIQITSKKWNDGSFFVDFDKKLPRDFRLGVFSDFGHWNPDNVKWDDFPKSKRPMVTVKQPSFGHDRWTHVVFVFANINSTSKKLSKAELFLDGQSQGALKQPMRYSWPTGAESKPGVIMLGLNYVGDMDELAVFRRALTAAEVDQLFRLPNGL